MRILTLTLDLPLLPKNITGFRAAIADTVGQEHEIFHNHHNSSGATHLHWDYPLIQYSAQGGKATIKGINAGADAIRQLLIPKLPDTLEFVEQVHSIERVTFHESKVSLVLQAEPQVFGLRSWIPFNNKNYKTWKSAEKDPEERQKILNRACTGHLRNMARSLGVPWYAAIHGEVLAVDEIKRVEWHGVPLVRLHARVASCFVPPYGLHCGRMVAYGFGELCSERSYDQWKDRHAQQSVKASTVHS